MRLIYCDFCKGRIPDEIAARSPHSVTFDGRVRQYDLCSSCLLSLTAKLEAPLVHG